MFSPLGKLMTDTVEIELIRDNRVADIEHDRDNDAYSIYATDGSVIVVAGDPHEQEYANIAYYRNGDHYDEQIEDLMTGSPLVANELLTAIQHLLTQGPTTSIIATNFHEYLPPEIDIDVSELAEEMRGSTTAAACESAKNLLTSEFDRLVQTDDSVSAFEAMSTHWVDMMDTLPARVGEISEVKQWIEALLQEYYTAKISEALDTAAKETPTTHVQRPYIPLMTSETTNLQPQSG